MTQIKLINPEFLPQYQRMSWAVEAGGLIHFSGIVAIDPVGTAIGPNDPEAQAQAILNIIERLLAEAGAATKDIVKMICFAVTPEAARAYVTARAERFPCRPAATTVIVSRLLNPALLLEVELIALAPKTSA